MKQRSLPGRKSSIKTSPARAAAFRILSEVESRQAAHSDSLLHGAAVTALDEVDRNLCTALVLGVLRWQLALDAVGHMLLERGGKLDLAARIALRMGLFQILKMDRIPHHAAIAESVELTKRAGHHFASRMVNAVLRRAAAESASLKPLLTPEGAHPAWMTDRWRPRFGAAETGAICNYDQHQPEACVRITEPGMAGHTDGDPGAFLNRARRGGTGKLLRSEFEQQDEGSQLVAEILASSLARATSILDCCAAPGGKTAILAERHPEAALVACDASETRMKAMQQRFASSAFAGRVEYKVVDMRDFDVRQKFELVLCDAPCSGTGTLARNPEIRSRLSMDDLLRQQKRQAEILRTAMQCVAPDGYLLYATCSLEAEENEEVVETVMQASTDFEMLAVSERIEEMRAAGIVHEQGAALLLGRAVSGEFLRTVPGVLPCDGFFAALMRRRSTARL